MGGEAALSLTESAQLAKRCQLLVWVSVGSFEEGNKLVYIMDIFVYKRVNKSYRVLLKSRVSV